MKDELRSTPHVNSKLKWKKLMNTKAFHKGFTPERCGNSKGEAKKYSTFTHKRSTHGMRIASKAALTKNSTLKTQIRR